MDETVLSIWLSCLTLFCIITLTAVICVAIRNREIERDLWSRIWIRTLEENENVHSDPSYIDIHSAVVWLLQNTKNDSKTRFFQNDEELCILEFNKTMNKRMGISETKDQR